MITNVPENPSEPVDASETAEQAADAPEPAPTPDSAETAASEPVDPLDAIAAEARALLDNTSDAEALETLRLRAEASARSGRYDRAGRDYVAALPAGHRAALTERRIPPRFAHVVRGETLEDFTAAADRVVAELADSRALLPGVVAASGTGPFGTGRGDVDSGRDLYRSMQTNPNDK